MTTFKMIFLMAILFPFWSSGSVFVQLTSDPAFRLSNQKAKYDTRSSSFQGSQSSIALGYSFQAVDLFLVQKTSNLNYEFDKATTEGKDKELGLGIGYKFQKSYQLGLEVTDLERKVKASGATEYTEYGGYNGEVFVAAKANLYKRLYITGKISHVLFGRLDEQTKSPLAPSLELKGRSFRIGLGYLF